MRKYVPLRPAADVTGIAIPLVILMSNGNRSVRTNMVNAHLDLALISPLTVRNASPYKIRCSSLRFRNPGAHNGRQPACSLQLPPPPFSQHPFRRQQARPRSDSHKHNGLLENHKNRARTHSIHDGSAGRGLCHSSTDSLHGRPLNSKSAHCSPLACLLTLFRRCLVNF